MILVTSGTGTVGSEVVKILKSQNVPVTAASRDPAKAMATLGVATLAWHWDRPRDFAKALTGVKTLFLCTPPGLVEEKSMGLNAVSAAKKAGVMKIVKLSAIGVEDMHESPHRQIELAIEAGPFQWVFLRPSFFMQNFNEGMAKEIDTEGRISVPSGDGRVGFIDARDIAAVAVAAMQGDALNKQGLTLTGSEALSMVDAANQLGHAIGKALRHNDLSGADYTAMLQKAGMPRHYAEFLATLYDQVVRKGFAATVTDNVRKITGRDPILFKQYAKDYAWSFKGKLGAAAGV
jgi:uncharacterized protein YbjT (DUF2867 family)